MSQQEKASKTPSPRLLEENGTRKHSPWTAPRYKKKNKGPECDSDDGHSLAQLPESPEGSSSGRGAMCMDEDLLVKLDGITIRSPAPAAATAFAGYCQDEATSGQHEAPQGVGKWHAQTSYFSLRTVAQSLQRPPLGRSINSLQEAGLGHSHSLPTNILSHSWPNLSKGPAAAAENCDTPPTVKLPRALAERTVSPLARRRSRADAQGPASPAGSDNGSPAKLLVVSRDGGGDDAAADAPNAACAAPAAETRGKAAIDGKPPSRYAVAAPFLDMSAFDAAATSTPEGAAAAADARHFDDSAECHHRQGHKGTSDKQQHQQGLRDSADELLATDELMPDSQQSEDQCSVQGQGSGQHPPAGADDDGGFVIRTVREDVSSSDSHLLKLVDLPQCNKMMKRAVRTCDFGKAQDIWATMQERMITPDMDTLKAFLKCALKAGMCGGDVREVARDMCCAGNIPGDSTVQHYMRAMEDQMIAHEEWGMEV